MRVAVLGPTGLGGSHVCVELLSRNHDVLGFSRNPEKLGKHDKYTPVQLDVMTAPIAEIVEALKNIDVLINSFNPPPRGDSPYKTFVETTRKIILASKAAKVGYFIMIGGTGSLDLPGEPYRTCADSREFWLAYRRSAADSEAATQHAQERMGPGPIADSMRAYRDARMALHAGKATQAHLETMKEVDDAILHGENWIPDLPVAARATFVMFQGNESFKWSFVSPPAGYWPGPRSGEYKIFVDELPLTKEAVRPSVDGNPYDGRLLGVSTADLAVAIVDEAEKMGNVGKHWTAVSTSRNDEPRPTYVTI